MASMRQIFAENPELTTLVSLAAVVILLTLLTYAWRLHRRIKILEKRQRRDQEAVAALRQQQVQDAVQGIRILAGAMLREELTLTEGSMRIAYLLTQVDASAQHKCEFSVFFQLARATAHIPVLEAWQKLSKQQQHAYTKERAGIEGAFAEFVLEAARGLLTHPTFKTYHEGPA